MMNGPATTRLRSSKRSPDEPPTEPYSLDALGKILDTLRKASKAPLTEFRVESVLNAKDADWANLIQNFQYLAAQYPLYRELETRSKFKNYRQILKHIA